MGIGSCTSAAEPCMASKHMSGQTRIRHWWRMSRLCPPTSTTAELVPRLSPSIRARYSPTVPTGGDHYGKAVRTKGGTHRVIATGMWGADTKETLARLGAYNRPIHRARGRINEISAPDGAGRAYDACDPCGLAKAASQSGLLPSPITWNERCTLSFNRPNRHSTLQMPSCCCSRRKHRRLVRQSTKSAGTPHPRTRLIRSGRRHQFGAVAAFRSVTLSRWLQTIQRIPFIAPSGAWSIGRENRCCARSRPACGTPMRLLEKWTF